MNEHVSVFLYFDLRADVECVEEEVKMCMCNLLKAGVTHHHAWIFILTIE